MNLTGQNINVFFVSISLKMQMNNKTYKQLQQQNAMIVQQQVRFYII